MSNFVYILGPAGCGKSTLTAVLYETMRAAGLEVLSVNLDPGAEWLPYTPEIDIRKDISLREVMREFRLGPNGALVVSVDLIVDHIPKIREIISKWNPDYVLVDTPGQMELFAFRDTGPMVVRAFTEKGTPLILFLIDAFLARSPSSFISMLMLSTSVLSRFRVAQLNVLTKADLLDEKTVEEISDWVNRKDALLEKLESEENPLNRENTKMILEAVEKMGLAGELLPISATENKGIVELVSLIERSFAAETRLDVQEEVEKF
ncbi:MAG: ATP/GTP-binding protein [Candidatus Hadarchaeales archaeon]